MNNKNIETLEDGVNTKNINIYDSLATQICCTECDTYIYENGQFCRYPNGNVNKKVTIENIKGVIMMEAGETYLGVLAYDGLHFITGIKEGMFNTFISNDELKKIGINKIKKIACGVNHMFVITNNGLYGMGDNTWNKLGIVGENINKLTKIDGCDDVVDIVCGYSYSICKRNNGKWYACGYDNYKIYGDIDILSKFREMEIKYLGIKIENIVNIHCEIICGPARFIIESLDGLFCFELRSNDVRKINFNDAIERICFKSDKIIILSNGRLFYGSYTYGLYYAINESLEDGDDIVDIYCSFYSKITKHRDGRYVMKQM